MFRFMSPNPQSRSYAVLANSEQVSLPRAIDQPVRSFAKIPDTNPPLRPKEFHVDANGRVSVVGRLSCPWMARLGAPETSVVQASAAGLVWFTQEGGAACPAVNSLFLVAGKPPLLLLCYYYTTSLVGSGLGKKKGGKSPKPTRA